MYDDYRPCEVCGAEVELRARPPREPDLDQPVGPEGGVVGTGDPTVEQRVCTNPSCPTNRPDADDDPGQ